ncbi:MAG: hypothetical protein PHI28_10790, partial [Mangrovibacterium sp.]|nr:hypothetical protein [Mangrovibacterium sp.]
KIYTLQTTKLFNQITILFFIFACCFLTMNVSKYISRKAITRILAGMAVVLCAVVFDALHEGSENLVKEMQQRSEAQFMYGGQLVFCNPVSPFKLKKGGDKLFSGLLFEVTRNEFLTRYHDCRAFHLLKAGSLKERRPFVRIIRVMDFNPWLHAGTDDDPLAG